jgi:hypothetical protein
MELSMLPFIDSPAQRQVQRVRQKANSYVQPSGIEDKADFQPYWGKLAVRNE